MTQTTPTTDADDEPEPSFWAMVRLMSESQSAEIRDEPPTGPVIPFPSPISDASA